MDDATRIFDQVRSQHPALVNGDQLREWLTVAEAFRSGLVTFTAVALRAVPSSMQRRVGGRPSSQLRRRR